MEVINRLTELIIAIMFVYLLTLSFIKKELNLFVISSLIFILWRSLSSYFFSEGVLDLVNSVRIISLILLTNMTIKKFPRSTLKALGIVFGLYIIINYITLLMFPDGLYLDNPREGQYREAWFLGIENQFAFFLVPGITLIILNSWFVYNKITKGTWLLIIITLLTILTARSATAVISLIFVFASIVMNMRKKIKPIFSFNLLSLIYILIWFVIVRINLLELFEPIIVSFLEKDLTLSGRTRIWSVIFETVPDSLWYGHGINTSVLAGVQTYFVAHNMILQTLVDNGIIGLFLFILSIAIAGNKLQEAKNNLVSVLLLIGLFGILVGGIAESYRINYLFLLLTISYNSNFLIKGKGKIYRKP